MKTYILLMIILIWSQEVESDTRRIVLCDRVEINEIGEGSPVSFSEVDMLYNETYGSVVNLDMFIARDLISSKLSISMELVRCAVKEALDTCEYFSKLRPPNICLFLNAKNMAWSHMMDSFTPRLRCPIRKGTYLGRGFAFDSNLWNMFPIHEWYWKVTTRLHEGKLHLYSLLMECKSIPYRNRTV